MIDIIELLTGYGTPVHSPLASGIHLNSGQADYDQKEYEDRLALMLERPADSFPNRKYAHMIYSYLGYYVIVDNAAFGKYDAEDCYQRACNKVAYEAEHSRWKFMEAVNVSEDSNGKSKTWRKDEALRLFAETPTMTRQEGIALFVEKLEMTPSGASTYFANAKKQFNAE